MDDGGAPSNEKIEKYLRPTPRKDKGNLPYSFFLGNLSGRNRRKSLRLRRNQASPGDSTGFLWLQWAQMAALLRSSVSATAGVPLVSWSAADDALSLARSQTRPFFLRTLPPPSSQGQSMWAWAAYFAVPVVSFFYTREALGEGLFQVI